MRNVLITGAAGGLGQAMVKKFVDEGDYVFAADLTIEELNKVVEAFPDKVTAIELDVTSAQSVQDAIDSICKKYNVDAKDRKILDQFTANRVAGLLMLYLAGDTRRINDIVNRYNVDHSFVSNILPEIEGYINK